MIAVCYKIIILLLLQNFRVFSIFSRSIFRMRFLLQFFKIFISHKILNLIKINIGASLSSASCCTWSCSSWWAWHGSWRSSRWWSAARRTCGSSPTCATRCRVWPSSWSLCGSPKCVGCCERAWPKSDNWPPARRTAPACLQSSAPAGATTSPPPLAPRTTRTAPGSSPCAPPRRRRPPSSKRKSPISEDTQVTEQSDAFFPPHFLDLILGI